MIKPFLSLSAALAITAFGPGAANAQSPIILNKTGYPGFGEDTVRDVADKALFGNLATPASNSNWDVSTANYVPGDSYIIRAAPTNAAFPGATFRGPMFTALGTVSYFTLGYYTRNANGVTIAGEEINTRQANSLGGISGNPSDSLIFPVQTIAYTGGVRKVLHFPATLGTTWNSTASSILNFNITVSAFGLNNTPGQRRTMRIQQDSVMGWGRMRVKDASGLASGYMNVLQVRSRRIALDSFFVGGAQAPATLLSAFGLQQGQGDTNTHVLFYRAGEYTPLTDLRYLSNTPTGQPDGMLVMQNRLSSAAGIADAAGVEQVKLFPNPVRGGVFSVKLPASGAFTYQVLAVSGAVVDAGTLRADASGSASLALPQGTAAGIYYLMLGGDARVGGPLVVPFEVAQ